MSVTLTRRVALEEFCITGSGGTPNRSNSQYYGGEIPWVKSGELRESIIWQTEEKITEEALKKSSAKIVPKGAILLAMYGATVGRLAMLGVDAATNQAVCNIRPDPSIADTKYVYRALEAKVPELVSQANGGAQPNISQEKVRKIRIPLPPLDEQKRIAAILHQADALRAKRRQAIALLDSLTQSIFLEMFGDLKMCPISSFGTLVKDAKIGLVRSAAETGDDFGTPYLRMDGITSDGSLDLTSFRKTHATDKEISSYELLPGDFLFNTRNSKELVGKSTVYRGPSGWVYNNNIMRVRFSESVNSFYVAAYFQTDEGRRALEARKSGTTSVFAIYQKSLDTMPIPVPPIKLQEDFADKVAHILTQKESLIASQLFLNALFTSLQNRAFTGQH